MALVGKNVIPADAAQSDSLTGAYKGCCWITDTLVEALVEYNAKKIINLGSNSVFDLGIKENK